MSDVLPAQSGQEAVKSVLEKLTGPDARLLTIRGGGPDDDEPIIDVTHEAILRGWSRLRSWLEQDFEYQLWKKRLRDGRQDWEDNLRHPDYLLRGAQLEQAEQWSVERQDDLSQVELEFLEASAGLRTIHEEETRRHQEKLRQEQDRRLESEARAASRLRKLAVILAVLALTAAFFGYDANQKAGIALSRELATTALNQLDINPDLAVLMALSAVVNHAHTRAEEEALHQAVQTARGPAFMGHEGKVNSLTYHPDGASLATASADRTTRLWDPATGVQLSALFRHQAELVDIGFSPDGDRLVLAGSDGAVEVIEVAAPDPIVSLPRHPDAVTGVSLSPDGARLATACWDGIGRIFDVESGRELFQLRGHSAGLHSIAFNADGKKVASASADGTAKVWDTQIGKELLNLGGQLGVDRGSDTNTAAETVSAAVRDVAFRPDEGETSIATAGLQGSVQLWDAETGDLQITLEAQSYGVASLSFSSDGERLAAAGLDGTVFVWNLDSESLLILRGPENQLTDVAFRPAGGMGLAVSAASRNGVVRYFPLSFQELITSARTHVNNAVTLTDEQRAEYPYQ